MKKLLLLILLGITVSAYGQTIKTDAGRRVAGIDTEIAVLQSQIAKASDARQRLLATYSSTYPPAVAVEAQLVELRQAMRALETEKKSWANKKPARPLPNTNVELLRILALQNERIIDLLEKLIKRSP